MNRAEYATKIKAAYEGEWYGEAWFDAMAAGAENAGTRHKFEAMARLEAQTRGHLEPIIARLGITGIDTAALREKGHRLAQQSMTLSWSAFIAWFESVIAPFVERYDELEGQGPTEDAVALSHLARHERALLEFARREAAGRSDCSIDPVLVLIDESPLRRMCHMA